MPDLFWRSPEFWDFGYKSRRLKRSFPSQFDEGEAWDEPSARATHHNLSNGTSNPRHGGGTSFPHSDVRGPNGTGNPKP